MEERLKALRKELDLNQQEFAEKINLGQSTWAMIEVGKRALNDRHILLICSVFNIRKEWLKEGKGEMFEKIPEEDEFFKAATELSKNNDKMVMQAVIEYWKLDDESKKLFKDFILHIVEKSKESNKELKE